MTKEHWQAFALLLAAIGSFGAGAATWGEVVQPKFIFGAMAACGAVLRAMFSDKPGGDK